MVWSFPSQIVRVTSFSGSVSVPQVEQICSAADPLHVEQNRTDGARGETYTTNQPTIRLIPSALVVADGRSVRADPSTLVTFGLGGAAAI
jgi:hypothetical protein